MNILVTGGNGQLGNCLQNAVRGSKDNYIFTDVAELDITDAKSVRQMVMDNDVKVIVNCAAYTNVDKAEDDTELAELLNATAVRNLAEAVKEKRWDPDPDFNGLCLRQGAIQRPPAGKTRRAHQQESTVSQNCTVSRKSQNQALNHSYSVPPGYTANMAGTL